MTTVLAKQQPYWTPRPSPPGPALVDDAPAVFVVDDDECLRAIIGDWVELAGFRAVRMGDGQSCLAAMFLEKPAAILLDLHMAGLSGTETLERIRKIDPDVPVIALTGEHDPALAFGLIEGGADELLLKPVKRSRLLQSLSGFVRGLESPVPV
jgi:FixJ family two-component response regulator